jgi:Tripartite tricarboxylate transporter TctB family
MALNLKTWRYKDLAGGLLMLVLGLATIFQSLQYELGTLRHMGPGYFPLVLGVILAACGLLITIGSRNAVAQIAGPRLPPEWRGWLCICTGIVAFIVIGEYGGLLPATFAIVFISALGDRQNSLLTAVLLALFMTLICFVVFWWLLQVQLPLFRWD